MHHDREGEDMAEQDSREAGKAGRTHVIERARVFTRNWLYVGHDAEIPERGDYRRRTVGGRPIFLVRGSDGEPRIFFNTCTHRGALVCRRDEGNAKSFQCFYHAWTFSNSGTLVGVPGDEAYGGTWNRDEMGLRSPAHTAVYRGLHFVNYDPEAADLEVALEPKRAEIDAWCDLVSEGGDAQVGGQRLTIQANWKRVAQALRADVVDGAGAHLYPALLLSRRGVPALARVEPLSPTSTQVTFTLLGASGAALFAAFPSLELVEDIEMQPEYLDGTNPAAADDPFTAAWQADVLSAAGRA
jgi:phenylpropionate dioxygenase-like ring-hydroxylating dioxygenase large terminal subunit